MPDFNYLIVMFFFTLSVDLYTYFYLIPPFMSWINLTYFIVDLDVILNTRIGRFSNDVVSVQQYGLSFGINFF